jgi:transposase-like protein
MSVAEILQEVIYLSADEKSQIIEKLIKPDSMSQQSDILNVRKLIHESNPIECPHCKSRKWIKFGLYRGSQKYRCSRCNRTYTALTRSSAYRIHDKEKWTKYFSCLLAGYSLHKLLPKLGLVIRHPLIGDIRFFDLLEISAKISLQV